MTERCNRCGRQLVAPDEIEVATCHACDDALFDALPAGATTEEMPNDRCPDCGAALRIGASTCDACTPDWSEDFDIGGEA